MNPNATASKWYRPSPLFLLVVLAVFASIASFLYFYNEGVILAYKDAQSHELIARRVWSSPTPGFGQLGAVWPILPHILILPFVWSDYLFYSGIAGYIVSMACFVGTIPYLYKTVEKLGGGTGGAVVACLVVILNANFLYIQSTPMSEPPLFFFMAASVYYFLCWSQETEKYGSLMLSALSLFLATLCRYEAWILLLLLSIATLLVCVSQRFERSKTVAHLIWFAPAFFGITFWLGWSFMLQDDPLYFQRGEYAKPSLWVAEGEKTVGNFKVSFLTYWYAMLENFSLPVIMLAGLGTVYFFFSVIFTRDEGWLPKIAPEGKSRLAALTLLFPFPFFVFALYQGQRPMRVEQITETLHNVRFALVMILPAAIFTGYLVRRSLVLQVGAVALIAFVSWGMFAQHDIVTLQDPLIERNTNKTALHTDAAVWLKDNYDGGAVLMESFGNEQLQFESKIPTKNLLYEGSYQMWDEALEQPNRFVRWIVLRYGGGMDKVAKAAADNPDILNDYELLKENEEFRIYRKPNTLSVRNGN